MIASTRGLQPLAACSRFNASAKSSMSPTGAAPRARGDPRPLSGPGGGIARRHRHRVDTPNSASSRGPARNRRRAGASRRAAGPAASRAVGHGQRRAPWARDTGGAPSRARFTQAQNKKMRLPSKSIAVTSQFQRRQAEQHQHHGDDPEAHHHLRFLPPFCSKWWCSGAMRDRRPRRPRAT